MRYEKTVILTDLDGTLFNSHGLVSKEDRAAIADYMARALWGGHRERTGKRPGTPAGFSHERAVYRSEWGGGL